VLKLGWFGVPRVHGAGAHTLTVHVTGVSDATRRADVYVASMHAHASDCHSTSYPRYRVLPCGNTQRCRYLADIDVGGSSLQTSGRLPL
jgi:hypothetical protein